jgi:preprotein translocase subunit SecA
MRRLFGSQNERKLRPMFKRVELINALEAQYAALSDAELRGETLKLKARLAAGETLDDILEDAFAVVREGSKRTLRQRHFDVQLVGGMVLHEGRIAEMKTGEGKTLVATLPVYLNALAGRGVHVVTVNDYLAKRDAEWMGQIYNFLGLTVGCILHGLDDEERRRAYAADVTYGTNNELGFDYLRDNMKFQLEAMVQRGHVFAIVDEVDSILIDEARTPLIISGPTQDQSELYKALDTFIPKLGTEHIELDEKTRQVHLTEAGNEFIEGLLKEGGLLKGDNLYDVENVTIVHHVTQALKAHKLFSRDKDYIVKSGKVVIIDEFTGRMMEGRRYSEGLHQALEAKEQVAIQPENVTLATITFQNYFRLYEKLAGMTGTAATEAPEFHDIYKLDVMEIPTNVEVIRRDYDDEVYRTVDEKLRAVVALIADCRKRGQPMLVGTTSIEKSEQLSALLKDRKYIKSVGDFYAAQADEIKDGKDDKLKREFSETASQLFDIARDKSAAGPIPHQVLNARYHEMEAQIVAQAGVPGAVMIATNMAGRGTDIQLGGNAEYRLRDWISEETQKGGAPTPEQIETMRLEINADVAAKKKIALDAGGLYVVATERHESRRIDNQLRGRSGRQGDPGASKFFLSIQDDLMRIFGSDRMDGMLRTLGLKDGEAIIHPWINKALEKAQQKVEARNFDIRKNLLKYDNVMNDQRKAIFEQRLEIMRADELADTIADMRREVVQDLVAHHIPERAYAEQWDTAGLAAEAEKVLGLKLPVVDWAKEEGIADEEIEKRLLEAADARAAARAANIGPDFMRRIEKGVLLETLDRNWREHIVHLDQLRQVVGLRGYGQRDPLNEYKTEAFSLFEHLLSHLREEVTQSLMNLEVKMEQAPPRPAPELPPMELHKFDPNTGRDEMGPAEPEKLQPRSTRPAAIVNPQNPATWGKPPRNSPCPCGSGKKFKHCHGAVSAAV